MPDICESAECQAHEENLKLLVETSGSEMAETLSSGNAVVTVQVGHWSESYLIAAHPPPTA